MNRAERILSLTRRGILRHVDLVDNLVYLASEMPAEELVGSVPDDTLSQLRQVVENAPRSDDEWASSLFIIGGSYRSTASQASDVARANYRKGIESLRRHFDAAASET